MAITVLGVAWIGLALAHGDPAARPAPRRRHHRRHPRRDVRRRHRRVPRRALVRAQRRSRRAISPNKTVEGLLIGMVTAILATWLAGTYQDWLSGTDALLLGLGVALAAPIGDLFESFVKRDAGDEGHRHAVRRPRRRAGPPRRRACSPPSSATTSGWRWCSHLRLACGGACAPPCSPPSALLARRAGRRRRRDDARRPHDHRDGALTAACHARVLASGPGVSVRHVTAARDGPAARDDRRPRRLGPRGLRRPLAAPRRRPAPRPRARAGRGLRRGGRAARPAGLPARRAPRRGAPCARRRSRWRRRPRARASRS